MNQLALTTIMQVRDELVPQVRAGVRHKVGFAPVIWWALSAILPYLIQLVVELLIHRHQEQRKLGHASDVDLMLSTSLPEDFMPETREALRETGP